HQRVTRRPKPAREKPFILSPALRKRTCSSASFRRGKDSSTGASDFSRAPSRRSRNWQRPTTGWDWPIRDWGKARRASLNLRSLRNSIRRVRQRLKVEKSFSSWLRGDRNRNFFSYHSTAGTLGREPFRSIGLMGKAARAP